MRMAAEKQERLVEPPSTLEREERQSKNSLITMGKCHDGEGSSMLCATGYDREREGDLPFSPSAGMGRVGNRPCPPRRGPTWRL